MTMFEPNVSTWTDNLRNRRKEYLSLRCRTMTSPWTYKTTPRAAAACSAKRIMPNRRLSMSRIKQVLRCYVAGKGTRSISDLLDISRNTVKKYITIFATRENSILIRSCGAVMA